MDRYAFWRELMPESRFLGSEWRDCCLDSASTNEWDRWDQESNQKSDTQRLQHSQIREVVKIRSSTNLFCFRPNHRNQVASIPFNSFPLTSGRFRHRSAKNETYKAICERKKQKIRIWDFVTFLGTFLTKVIGKVKFETVVTLKIGFIFFLEF